MKTRILLLAAVAIAALSSCSKDSVNNTQDAEVGEGYCALVVSEPMVDIILKSSETAIDDDYGIIITQTNGDYTITSDYGSLKELFVLPVGTYSIVAQNISSDDAIDGRGAQHFYGATTFAITAGVTTDVAFECTMVNSRVSAVFDDAFKAAFTSATLSVYESSDLAEVDRRELEFGYNTTLENEEDFAYFNIDSDPQIIVVISATRNDGVEVNDTKTIDISANTWHRLTVTSTSTDGLATLDVSVDTSLTSSDLSFDVDPYM